MGYSPEQRRIIAEIMRQTRRDRPRIRRAALMAGLVETNLHHLGGGDRDSQGFLQQRPSQGWGPYRPGMRGVRVDLRQFLERARLAMRQGFEGGPGALAQHVQRSAYPDRYGERRGEVDAILRQFGGGDRYTAGIPGGAATMPPGAGDVEMPTGDGRRELALALMQTFRGGEEKPSLMDVIGLARSARDQPSAPNAPAAGMPGMGGMAGPQGGAAAMRAAIAKAQQMGLAVRENPAVDPVDPVHVDNSWHYRTFPRHPGLGRGLDVSGPANLMRRYALWLDRNRAREQELFYDPLGGRFRIGGHSDHVHVAY